MVSINKKIKLFNKVLRELLKEYNIINIKQYSIKVKEYSILAIYKSEVNKIEELFINCDKSCLKNISLCNDIDLDSLNLETYNNNNKIIWKYLHALYFITLEKVDDNLILDSKRSINNIESKELENAVKNAGSAGMQSMINDITKEVTNVLQGQDLSDLNPLDLINQLISGNSIKGIDLNSIIQSSVLKMQTKVDNGEIDLEQIQNIIKPFVPKGFEDKINELD